MMLTHRDLNAALAVVAEAAAADGGTPFERPVIDRLLQLVPADRAGFYECPRFGATDFLVETSPNQIDWRSVADVYETWPLRDWLPDTKPVATFDDFVPSRRRLSNPWYVDVMRPTGVEHELKLRFPTPANGVCGFFFLREPGHAAFDDRDRSLLTLLQPHLAAIRARWERQRRRHELTPREVEVLRLVRDGLTNRQIAERLFISRTTVRTHLENVFEKLDVHTRTQAVVRAFGH